VAVFKQPTESKCRAPTPPPPTPPSPPPTPSPPTPPPTVPQGLSNQQFLGPTAATNNQILVKASYDGKVSGLQV
jgi:hypothetical protein